VRRLILVVALVGLAACGSSSGSSSSPKGVDQAVWDSYCRNGSNLAETLGAINKGTLTTTEAAARLASNESDLEGDASALNTENAGVGAKVQAVADAVGRLKVSIDAGEAGDLSEVTAAAGALPACA
jgi:hypothetical protein